jgi:hypothetical protein
MNMVRAHFADFESHAALLNKGSYAVYVNKEVKYVGECDNLSSRWNIGYGNISPRNCFVGGQSTNCRINNLILITYKSNGNIDLYFHETQNRFQVENDLIKEMDPDWNIKKSNSRITREPRQGVNSQNKYQKIGDYLKGSTEQSEKLIYEEMEDNSYAREFMHS